MARPSHMASPDLPGEAGSAGVIRGLSCPRGYAEAPDLTELGEGPETAVPAVRPGGRIPRVPEPRGSVDYGKPQCLDTLAGGTPICMYRQWPPGPPRERNEPAGGAKSQHRAGWTARSRQVRAWMSFCPSRGSRRARPLRAPRASDGSDSCLIRARRAARAVRIPPFSPSSSGHTIDWRARAH
jgi:hypothetical protein